MIYRYLSKIIITAKKERPVPPILSVDSERDYVYLESSPILSSYTSRVDISDIRLTEWDVNMEYDYLEKFKKVADVVGHTLAEEVMKILDS